MLQCLVPVIILRAQPTTIRAELLCNRTTHYSAATFLTHAGIPVWIDVQHAIAHNKVMIIDGNTVLTGSFDFTKAAEQQNAENLLTIRDAALAEQYTANWQKHLDPQNQGHARLGRSTSV